MKSSSLSGYIVICLGLCCAFLHMQYFSSLVNRICSEHLNVFLTFWHRYFCYGSDVGVGFETWLAFWLRDLEDLWYVLQITVLYFNTKRDDKYEVKASEEFHSWSVVDLVAPFSNRCLTPEQQHCEQFPGTMCQQGIDTGSHIHLDFEVFLKVVIIFIELAFPLQKTCFLGSGARVRCGPT